MDSLDPCMTPSPTPPIFAQIDTTTPLSPNFYQVATSIIDRVNSSLSRSDVELQIDCQHLGRLGMLVVPKFITINSVEQHRSVTVFT